MKRLQITVNEQTEKLLEKLAAPRAGNKSFVIREAIQRMAEQEGFEEYLDWLEHQPAVRASLDRALDDERNGRLVSHEAALQRLQSRRR